LKIKPSIAPVNTFTVMFVTADTSKKTVSAKLAFLRLIVLLPTPPLLVLARMETSTSVLLVTVDFIPLQELVFLVLPKSDVLMISKLPLVFKTVMPVLLATQVTL
jgi:hypothetical protein